MKGKDVIVTGASRGLGKAIALGFAKEGAQVVAAAAVLLAKQDSKGITGTIATDREICTRHGLTHSKEV